jgi:hypothetical protein
MCGSGARYFFIFNLLTGLGLVIVQSRTSGFAAGAARALVILSLLCGILDVISIAKSPRSPIWSQEVALWRDDPSHRLQIGPGAWPGVRLTPQPGNKVLPTNIYDSTIAGWQDR